MADIFDFYVYDDRSIRFSIAEPIMLEDKDVTQFRFRIPKVLNNIDMTDWEWWFIFVNAKKVKYTTQLTLTDDEDDPDNFSVATYTVGYGFSGYIGSVSFSIEALNVSGEDIVNEWHTRTYNTTVTDTLQGSRAVIPEPGGQSGTGLTEEIRQALLQIARKVAYIDEHGQTYYNNLYDALYAIQAVTVSPTRVGLTTIGATSQLIGATVPSGGTITWTSSDTSVATVSNTGLVTSVGYGTATITATSGGKSATCSVVVAQAQLEDITAVYTQSGTVYDTDTLDSLKPDLVVTAYYDNQTSAAVTDYTLSGTLTDGTSTITVSYAGLTDTFSVTVSTIPYVTDGLIAYWDGIDNTGNGHDASATKWTDIVGGYELTMRETTHTTWDTNAVSFDGNTSQGLYCDSFWSRPTNATIEVVLAPSATGTQGVATFDRSDSAISGSNYDARRFLLYSDNTVGFVGKSGNTYTNPLTALTNIRKLVAEYTDFTVDKGLINGQEVSLSGNTHSYTFSGSPQIRIGAQSFGSTGQAPYTGKIYAMRVYNRKLTAEELAKNLAYDNDRFSLGLTL